MSVSGFQFSTKPVEVADPEKLTAHEATQIVPACTAEEFEEMRTDIVWHGLLHPIVLYKGQVLDGLTRHRACIETATPPRFVELTKGDPFMYALSANVSRRHLTTSQRALIAAQFHRASEAALTPKRDTAPGSHAPKGLVQVARSFGVSTRSAEDGVAVLESGNAALIESVRSGTETVSSAAKTVRASRAAAPYKAAAAPAESGAAVKVSETPAQAGLDEPASPPSAVESKPAATSPFAVAQTAQGARLIEGSFAVTRKSVKALSEALLAEAQTDGANMELVASVRIELTPRKK